jgi:hypothetical protein
MFGLNALLCLCPHTQYNGMSHIKICYSPSLDNFHTYLSNGCGMDVDKVGPYCIFSYTDMFQDLCGKACVQSVHSEAASFRRVPHNHRIPRNTSSYTCGPPCSRHSFWYKAWYTGTANRPFFLYIIFRVLILAGN